MSHYADMPEYLKFIRAGNTVMPTYKIDGAKFQSLEELKESLWPLYEGRMSRDEFEKYVQENVQKTE